MRGAKRPGPDGPGAGTRAANAAHLVWAGAVGDGAPMAAVGGETPMGQPRHRAVEFEHGAAVPGAGDGRGGAAERTGPGATFPRSGLVQLEGPECSAR